MKPDFWQPIPLHIQELQQLVNRLDTLIDIKNQETNRQKDLCNIVISDVKSHIKFLDEQIKNIEKLVANHIKKHKDLSDKDVLLASIPGIGKKTTAVIYL